MGKNVWNNLKKFLGMGILAGGLLIPLTSKAANDNIQIDNMTQLGVGGTTFQTFHYPGAQEGNDVYDALWSDMPPNPNSKWLKIYTAPYGDELVNDCRPTNSLTKFQIKGSVVDGDGTGVTSTNYITFNFLTTDANRNYKGTFNMPCPYSASGQAFNWSGIVTNGTRIDTPGITNAPDGAQIWTMDLESLVKINATKTGNGTVSPSGITLVPYQGSTNFSVTATQPGNRIESILTNGVVAYTNSIGDNSMIYTNFPWNNVTKDSNTLAVVFAPKTYPLVIESFGVGTNTPSGTLTMTHGSGTNIQMNSGDGHHIDRIIDNGATNTFGGYGNYLKSTNYPVANVTASNNIKTFYDYDLEKIVNTAGPNGTIGPAGTNYTTWGANAPVNVDADSDYQINSLTTNGVPVPDAAGQTNYVLWLNNVRADIDVYASFAERKTTNGIPFTWFTRYGLTNKTDSGELENPDGDRMSNWQEYMADTDPTTNTSYFSIADLKQGNSLELSIPNSSTNRTYYVDASSNLADSAWQEGITNSVGTGSNLTFHLDAPSEDLKKFYRARVGMN